METSITDTVADLDGGEDQSTITVSVAGNNRVPIFFGGGPLPNGAAPYTLDIAPLFDDFDDDALAYTATGLPSGFALINGVLAQADPVDPAGAGDHTASIWTKGGGSLKAVLSAVCSERPLSSQNSQTETQLAGGFVRSSDKPISNDDSFQVAEGAVLVAGARVATSGISVFLYQIPPI